MREVAEVGKDAMRERSNGCVSGRACIAEDKNNGNDADDRRDDGQRPNSLAGAERPGVQDAEMLRSLVVLAHGVGYASAGVHTAKRGADKGQKYSDGLCQHEE